MIDQKLRSSYHGVGDISVWGVPKTNQCQRSDHRDGGKHSYLPNTNVTSPSTEKRSVMWLAAMFENRGREKGGLSLRSELVGTFSLRY